MGLLAWHIRLLATRSAEIPICGEVLTLGQQSVRFSFREVQKLLAAAGVEPVSLPASLDISNKIPAWSGTENDRFTNGQAVLHLLGADSVSVLDVSDYEGAEIVIDLNENVPEELHERFDTIFDSGTLEHVFDVPTALANLTAMLREGGRVVLISPASNAIDHGFFSFSPTLYFDYFEENGFGECVCFLRPSVTHSSDRPMPLYRYRSAGGQYPLMIKDHVDMIFSAVKKQDVAPKKPIQRVYVRSPYWAGEASSSELQPVAGRSIRKAVRHVLEKVERGPVKPLARMARALLSRNPDLIRVGKI